MSTVHRRCNGEEVTMVPNLKFVDDGDDSGEFVVGCGGEVAVGGGEVAVDSADCGGVH